MTNESQFGNPTLLQLPIGESCPPWIHELQFRELIKDFSDIAKLTGLSRGDGFYVGFDPTARSLQLGNLVPLIVAIHLARAGFTPIILFGGATGAIGDPSGKDKERVLLSREEIDANIKRQKIQVRKIFQPFNITPHFVNNLDWTKDISYLEFLRDTGKHFTVNFMIHKEVVRARLEGSGISYTEFSYMLLQAYDFLHLFQNHGVKLQIGGSDQWGNITAGLELIRRKGVDEKDEAVAFSFPLLTSHEGKKFGKSEGGAIWLDSETTSPYRLHQFLYNVQDEDVLKYLKCLTFSTREELDSLAEEVSKNPEQRTAQRKLADDITLLIHGDDAVEQITRGREVLFGGPIDGDRVSESALLEVLEDVPSTALSREMTLNGSVLDLVEKTGLQGSRGEAKRMIAQGGVYLNNMRVDSPGTPVKECQLMFPNIIILRSGKKRYHLVKLED